MFHDKIWLVYVLSQKKSFHQKILLKSKVWKLVPGPFFILKNPQSQLEN